MTTLSETDCRDLLRVLDAIERRVQRTAGVAMPLVSRAVVAVAVQQAGKQALQKRSFWRTDAAKAMRRKVCACRSGGPCQCQAGPSCRRVKGGQIVCVHPTGDRMTFDCERDFKQWAHDWGKMEAWRAYYDASLGGRIIRG
jgi:hypothetical protein